jgi:hypothetical protein
MKKLLRFLPLAFLPLLAPTSKAQVTLIQTCAAASFGAGANCTFASPVGTNHHIIVSVVTYGGFCNQQTFNDSLGLAYTEIIFKCANFSGNFLSMGLYCVNTQSSSGSDTLSPAGFFGGGYLASGEYSGLAHSGATCSLDGSNGAGSTTSGSGPITTGSVTTTLSNDLLVAAGWYYLTANAGLTAPTGFTSEVYYNTCTGCSNQVAHMLADKTVSVGTYTPTFAMATTGNWIGIQVAFVSIPPAATGTQCVFVICP